MLIRLVLNLTSHLCDAVMSLGELLSKYSFQSNWDVIGAGGIIFFVNTMPTPKSCNYTRKIIRDRIFKCNYNRTPCNLVHSLCPLGENELIEKVNLVYNQ